MDWKIELIHVPVSDVDRAKEFYTRIGFHPDHDQTPYEGLRFVQMTPPGSACSIAFGTNLGGTLEQITTDSWQLYGDLGGITGTTGPTGARTSSSSAGPTPPRARSGSSSARNGRRAGSRTRRPSLGSRTTSASSGHRSGRASTTSTSMT